MVHRLPGVRYNPLPVLRVFLVGLQRASRNDFQLDVDFDELETLGPVEHCDVEEISISMLPVVNVCAVSDSDE